MEFQSTRPARGATPSRTIQSSALLFQSTRPARGATFSCKSVFCPIDISIHAPREGRDVRPGSCTVRRTHFNPRAPRGARRQHRRQLKRRTKISIHAPREGRDATSALTCGTSRRYFNPRAPRGARPRIREYYYSGREFQSTRPARGATFRSHSFSWYVWISIHAPREGRDRVEAFRVNVSNISIHAPREGRDYYGLVRRYVLHHFNPRAPRGARLLIWELVMN